MNNEDSAPRAPSAELPPTDPPPAESLPATDVSAPTATPTLVLHTFGECRLVQRTDGYEHTLYEGSNKALALLTYLACAPGRSAMRTHVQEILWGRRPTEAAQGAVRTYLWKLRKTLGPDVIVGDEILRLTSAIEVDRELMLDAANRGDMEAAVAF